MKYYLQKLLLISFIFLISVPAWATHIRGGEITLKRVSLVNLTYEITLTTYTDIIGKEANNSVGENSNFTIYSGSQIVYRETVKRKERRLIRDDTEINTYVFTYTFPANTNYIIGVDIPNRNAGVVNIAQSDKTSFFIQTAISLNSGFGVNSTPILLNPAVDFTAAIGQVFIHNPNAFDAEGDSLSYQLTVPKFTRDGSNVPENVIDYANPNVKPTGVTEANNGPSTFKINAITGDLIWDAPAAKGQYNVAFEIREWRKGNLLSITVRDMQIIVGETNNKRPKLTIVDEICVQAGEELVAPISAADIDGNNIVISATGPIFDNSPLLPAQIALPFATLNKISEIKGDSKYEIKWKTNCNHIRNSFYEILVKATDDNPKGRLTDSKTLRIKVVAPALKETKFEIRGASVFLTWQKYICFLPGAKIQVYRKENCVTFVPNSCIPGIPASLGYQLIDTIPADTTAYLDKNVALNNTYSYRFLVKFADETGGGTSIVSDEICAKVELKFSLMTKVSTTKTNKTEGEIGVKWTRPFSTLTSNALYEYRLFRTAGNQPAVQGDKKNTLFLKTENDTSFVDTKLNTVDLTYNYFVELWSGNTKLAISAPAGAVRLSTTSVINGVDLNWTANVPWDNTKGTHKVFRKVGTGAFNQIAEIPFTNNNFSYSDKGLDNFVADGTNSVTLSSGQTYCYFVETSGIYNQISLQPAFLLNFSQETCASPKEATKACPPVLVIDALDCEKLKLADCKDNTFTNKLTWTTPQATGCDVNYVSFDIYFKRYNDDLFTKIATVPSGEIRNFEHKNLSSYAGCYYIVGKNAFGNESDKSATVCKDNCNNLLLFPNVFTPNNDGVNDDFQPMYCGKFIKAINFSVVNRNGQKVYQIVNAKPTLNWKGVNSSGEILPAGFYLYTAEVTFDRLERVFPKQTVKAWVEIIR